MKVLFVTSVQSHGSGGHFHSLNAISIVQSKKHEISIITIGRGQSEVLINNPFYLKHIEFYGWNLLSFRLKLTDVIQSVSPDVIHFFDIGSYNVLSVLHVFGTKKIVVNKCGGPNPTRFPFVKNLIVFSEENYKWFSENKNFTNSNVYLIPNRVGRSVIQDEGTFHITKDSSVFNIVRICRIGQTYKKSIFDSLQLLNFYITNGIENVKLHIFGVVEDATVLESIELHVLCKAGFVSVYTDSESTFNAARHLHLADAVVGTGRGLMEAAALGIPIFSIDANSNFPVLLFGKPFFSAFNTNFSERNVFEENILLDKQENALNLVLDENFRNVVCRFVKEQFDSLFLVDNAAVKYDGVYDRANFHDISYFKDLLIRIRTIIRYARNK